MAKYDVDAALERVRHYLPLQGPIKDFLHFNALGGFQSDAFEEAVLKAGEFYGAHAYMPLSYYRAAYRDGQIDEPTLNEVISEWGATNEIRTDYLRLMLFEYVEMQDDHVFQKQLRERGIKWESHGLLRSIETRMPLSACHYLKIRHGIDEQLSTDLDAQVNAVFFRTVSGYLDQGVALWQFPTSDLPFFESVRALVTQSRFPLADFIRRESCLAWLSLTPDEIIEELLLRIVGEKDLYDVYIKDTLMSHAGWSGLVNYLETKPTFLVRERRITLKELLAFKLVLEWGFIETSKSDYVSLSSWVTNWENAEAIKARHKQVLSWAYLVLCHPELDDAAPCNINTLCRMWHDALEKSNYKKLLSAIHVHKGHQRRAQHSKASVQAIFCLDDRECSFRRHLEELDPTIETFGWPGFFGIDFLFQSLNDPAPVQLCPPVLSPRHVVKEQVPQGKAHEYAKQKAKLRKTAVSIELWREASGSLFLGFLAAATLGHVSLFKLLTSLLNPQTLMKSLKSRRIDVPTELSVWRSENDTSDTKRQDGFTHVEMATRVENVLRGMGLTRDFAPLIAVVAHGASSVNNPHFAAYDCAACSGKSGAPNARVIAHIANIPQVRHLLAQRGIHIPPSTVFIGALHDTTTDYVEYFDLEKVTSEHQHKVSAFVSTVDNARARNAKERCRRFMSVPLEIGPEEALNEVSKRALALFEPRAELGHATCFSCIIGRRDLTRGLFLDRRAFLNSYDPRSDGTGQILTQILSAAIPVCGTVNLDYYFSRIDPGKYGCGTKLSHNICGLLGVCNGVDDDLRTGLPVQMTELHDPIRLLIVIEQKTDIIAQVLSSNAHLRAWVEKEWVRIASVDPDSGSVMMCRKTLECQRVEGLASHIPVRKTSQDCYAGLRAHAPMASITG